MSRIGDGDGGRGPSGPGKSPWPDEAEGRVRNVRKAITSKMDGEPVDTEVAPLLPDLLTRLESLSGPSASEGTDAPSPSPPEEVAPPSPSEEVSLLRRAESKLQKIASQAGGSRESAAVDAMLEVLHRYRQLREEVMMRTGL